MQQSTADSVIRISVWNLSISIRCSTVYVNKTVVIWGIVYIYQSWSQNLILRTRQRLNEYVFLLNPNEVWTNIVTELFLSYEGRKN